MRKRHEQTTAPTGGGQDIALPRTPIRHVLSISKQFKLLAAGGIFAVVVAQGAELGAIYVISELVDSFNAAADKTAQLDVLFFWGTLFILLGLLDRIAWRTSGFTVIAWAIKADAESYRRLYGYVSQHSHNYFLNRFAGSISNKISNASGNTADFIMRFAWDILPEAISLTVTWWLLTDIHWLLGQVFLIMLVIVFLFNLYWVKKRRPMVVAYSEASSAFRGVGVDLLTNIATMRQYARRQQELAHIDTVLHDRVRKDFRQSYFGEWLMVINGVFGVVLMSAIVAGVYIMLERDLATAGELVLVLFLLARVGYTFNIMGQQMNGFVRRYGEIEEGLQEVIVPHEIVDMPDAPALVAKKGAIEWSNVTFHFDTNTVFNSFDLTIPAGQRVGLVGASGAGKTTFASLLLRQHDVTDGVIRIDGQDISSVTQESLRSAIAIVPQEPMLFHRSIAENIAYGKPDATKAEIRAAAAKAQALDFILDLPEKFDTLVGERGVKLSGGQKQRVAIARAMLKDAPILLLDEATSALDSESEVEIQKALHQLMREKTVIAIAHRLSTLREMDRIIVLDNGKIVEDGSHDALVAYDGVYAGLWKHQAGGFLQD